MRLPTWLLAVSPLYSLAVSSSFTSCNATTLHSVSFISRGWLVAFAMSKEKRREFYLRKAKEAEEQVASTNDSDMKAKWQKIAEDYRALARLT